MKDYRFETLQLHAGQESDPVTGCMTVPIYQTSAYKFQNCDHAREVFELSAPGNIYGRLTNSTTAVLEERVAALEGGTGALALASGQAAVFYSIMNIAKCGDNIVSAATIYGGSYNLFSNTLPNYGITSKFVNADIPTEFDRAVDQNTKAIFIEVMANPNNNIIDIEAVASIAKKHKIPLIVDNTFPTPYLMKPKDYGANIVVHSATKFIGGHANSLGGIVVDCGNFDWDASGRFDCMTKPDPSYHGMVYSKADAAPFTLKMRAVLLRDTGACISPFNSFLLLQGIETLSLRVERHNENANKIAQYLSKCPHVERVNHPSLKESPYYELGQKYFKEYKGSIFTMELEGGFEKTKQFADSLELFSLVANVADAKSLVIHPASTTHSQMTEQELKAGGIYSNTIRLSVGIENVLDLIADLENAFKKAYER